jgi:uncharacterized membrane protein
MSWTFLALLTAFFESVKDATGKLALRGAHPVQAAFAWRLLALPVLLPLLAAAGWPQLGPGFWPALALDGGLNLLASILYMRALAVGELALTVPLVNLTPALLLVTSPLLVDEYPSPAGLAGVILVVAGTFALHRGPGRGGTTAALRNLLTRPGARSMLVVAGIWSITANIDKLGVRSSSPLAWAVAVDLVITLGLLPFLGWRKCPAAPLPGPALLATGLAGGLTLACQMTAIGLTQVPYVIAIKRGSTLLSVLWGRLLFADPRLGPRLLAVLLMLAGVWLILLA